MNNLYLKVLNLIISYIFKIIFEFLVIKKISFQIVLNFHDLVYLTKFIDTSPETHTITLTIIDGLLQRTTHLILNYKSHFYPLKNQNDIQAINSLKRATVFFGTPPSLIFSMILKKTKILNKLFYFCFQCYLSPILFTSVHHPTRDEISLKKLPGPYLITSKITLNLSKNLYHY